jgi:tellurite resistance protein TerC
MPLWAWLVFGAVVVLSMTVDALVIGGKHGGGARAATVWSVGWIAAALVFDGWVWTHLGRDAGEDFLSAYLVEKSLSFDTVFVSLVVFTRLSIPPREQHRVLFFGSVGAMVSRAALVVAGTTLLHAWRGLVYVLGAFLILAGVRTARLRASAGEVTVLSFVGRHLRVTPTLHGHHFFVVNTGRCVATPLFLALLVIFVTDAGFALDSIPAVFAVTEEPFIVYSSNIFAVLGLGALYPVVAHTVAGVKYLHYGLAALLVLAGTKMLFSHLLHVRHAASLVTVAGIIAVTIVSSRLAERNASKEARRLGWRG